MKNISTSVWLAVTVFSMHCASAQNTESVDQIEVGSSQSAQEVVNEQFQSSVKVRQSGSTTVKEYQNRGTTYKVEVAPKDTPAYILSDQDGNGKINNSDTSIDSDVVVPEWTIGNW